VHWEKLADYLELSSAQKSLIDTKPNFILNLPRRLAAKIEKGNLNDPLLLQFLPTLAEKTNRSDFVSDPTEDTTFCKSPKLLQKYQNRALLICTSACAMHCRYCFRQNFDYDQQGAIFEKEIQIIAEDSSIHEIILSGGDPLSLSNDILEDLFQRLSQIPHIRRIRIHTRFPIGIPERIDSTLLAILRAVPVQMWIIIHANHARELDEDVLAALSSLRKLGIVMMNQSVLLRGVNDNLESLKDLCEKLANNGIVPYYLHQLDRVAGSEHFEVSVEKGKWLVSELRKQLSGYAIPTYVAEIAGKQSKTPL
jgi:EF-P beta-lysylation protein EpmB